MPTVQKQQPNPAGASVNGVQRAAGSILSRAVPVKKLPDIPFKGFIYGQGGVGKTTLACQWEKPLLLVSFEQGQNGGAQSVKRMDGVTFLKLTKKEDAIALAKELRDDTTFKSHVLDTCTSLQEMILAELMNLEFAPVQPAWGSVPEGYYQARSEQAKEVIKFFLDLPANTIIVAQEKDHNPPKDVRNKISAAKTIDAGSFFSAAVGESTARWMTESVDFALQLQTVGEVIRQEVLNNVDGQEIKQTIERVTGKRVRRLRCEAMTNADGFANFATKGRWSHPGAVPEFILVPSSVPAEQQAKVMHAAILEVIAGKQTKLGIYPPG